MNSDSSDSPLVLTPESTGTNVSQLNSLPNSPAGSAAAATRKARRQTAIYPNMNASNKPQNPFSRSAAKRESVMALGSIEHLQYFFTKTGLAAKKKLSDKAHLGLVPAIGGRGHVPSTPSITTLSDFVLPSPTVPSPPTLVFPPHVKNYDVDPESLLPGVIQDLVSVAEAWKLEEKKKKKKDDESASSDLLRGAGAVASFDVLEVLKITTRAIRSTRNYLLSLWDESEDTLRKDVQFRSRILGSMSRKPSSSSINAPTTTTTTTTLPSTSSTTTTTTTSLDPISRIRRSALEVLTVLRQLEENYRLPLEDEAYDAQSDGGHSRGGTGNASSAYTPLTGNATLPPDNDDDHQSTTTGRSDPDPDMSSSSISFSLVQVQGQYKTVPVWEEEDDDDDLSPERDERRQKDPWEDRLVLGTGWLYRQDVRLSELERERAVVASYLDTVDEVLFDGHAANTLAPTSERGWHRVRKQREGRGRTPNRRVSVGVVGVGDSDGEGKSFGGLGIPTAGAAVRGERRRVSTGMVNMMDVERMHLSDEPEEMENDEEGGDVVVSDADLPEWARRAAFAGDELGRAHAMLAAFLPSSLVPSLRRPDSRPDFLRGLSSGQLLCVAYNACIRRSKQPWGYVSKNGIHDILALEEEAAAAKTDGEVDVNKRVWTFRRTDNLRLWVGALKLRYMLPVQMPFQPLSNSGKRSGTPTPSSSSPPPSALLQTFSDLTAREPPILFDAKVVAKREDGWEDMLENVLLRWVEKAVEERRTHH